MDQFIVVYFVKLQKTKKNDDICTEKKTHLKANLITMFLELSSKLKQWKILKILEDCNTNDYLVINSNSGIGLQILKNQCLYYIDQL
jgi:hypothetical protein